MNRKFFLLFVVFTGTFCIGSCSGNSDVTGRSKKQSQTVNSSDLPVPEEDLDEYDRQLLLKLPGLKFETRHLTANADEIVLDISGATYDILREFHVQKLRLNSNVRGPNFGVRFYLEWDDEFTRTCFDYFSPPLLVGDFFPVRGAIIQVLDIVNFPSAKRDPGVGNRFGGASGQVKLKIFKTVEEMRLPEWDHFVKFPSENRTILPLTDELSINSRSHAISLWTTGVNGRPTSVVVMLSPRDLAQSSSVFEATVGSELDLNGKIFVIRRIQEFQRLHRYVNGWIELEPTKNLAPL